VALTRTELWHRAQKVIPGGVNSPVRAMRGVGLDEPFFVRRGDGATLETADGRTLLDWVQSWGPLIFGHADAETVEAVREAALDGTSFGAPTEREVELVAVRTAEVTPGPQLELPDDAPASAVGPALVDLDGSSLWIPPGWVGARDGPSWVVTHG